MVGPVIIPISSKNGIVLLASGGVEVFGEEFSCNLRIDNDAYRTYDQTADAVGIRWAQVITGFAEGDGTVRAKYDNTPGSDLPLAKGVWLDSTGVGFLGYSSLVGFIIAYTIIACRGASNTGNPGSNMFDFDIKITGCDFTLTGP